MNLILLIYLLILPLVYFFGRKDVAGFTAVDWAEIIQSARIWMDDMVSSNNPRLWSKKTGFIDWLLNSDTNPRTINTTMLRNAEVGDYRGVQIRHTAHSGENDLNETESSMNCNAVNYKRDTLTNVEPSLVSEVKFTLTEQYVRQNGENGVRLQERVQREILDARRKLIESIDKQLLSAAATAKGANPSVGTGAGTWENVPLTYSADGTIDARYFDRFVNDMEDNHMAGPFGIVGLGNFRKYMNRLAVGSVFSDDGLNYQEVMRQFGMGFYKDHFTTDSIGGANRILLFAPGLTQFYQYVHYAADQFQIDHGDFIKTTFDDPVYPIRYDYQISYDNNCTTGQKGINGSWTHRFFIFFDLWTTPEGAFGDTYSDLNDFNGIVGYNITES